MDIVDKSTWVYLLSEDRRTLNRVRFEKKTGKMQGCTIPVVFRVAVQVHYNGNCLAKEKVEKQTQTKRSIKSN